LKAEVLDYACALRVTPRLVHTRRQLWIRSGLLCNDVRQKGESNPPSGLKFAGVFSLLTVDVGGLDVNGMTLPVFFVRPCHKYIGRDGIFPQKVLTFEKLVWRSGAWGILSW